MRRTIAAVLAWLAEGLILACQLHDAAVVLLAERIPWQLARLLPGERYHRIKGHHIHDRGETYMERAVLFQCRWFRVYVHRFLRSDLDVPHDHPWSAWAIQLRGSYEERSMVRHRRIDPEYQGLLRSAGWGYFEESRTRRRLLQVTRIGRERIHRVVLDRTYPLGSREAPLTVCICGPRHFDGKGKDDWGFWPEVQLEGQGPGITARCRIHWEDHLPDPEASH